MKYDKLKGKEKGVVGLEILLSIVAMLFVIGILIMAFTIAGTKLGESVAENGTGSLINSTLTTVDELGEYPTGTSTLNSCAFTVTQMYNTSDASVIPSTNYTITGCNIMNSGDNTVNNTNWNVTGTYTYKLYGEAEQVINETKVSLGDVTDWFSTYIVMASIVVIILLVVIIINAVRGGGLMGGQGGA